MGYNVGAAPETWATVMRSFHFLFHFIAIMSNLFFLLDIVKNEQIYSIKTLMDRD